MALAPICQADSYVSGGMVNGFLQPAMANSLRFDGESYQV
jgi:hypothetical protein